MRSGHTNSMQRHARPTSPLFGSAGTAHSSPSGPAGAKHARPSRLTARLQRRILAYSAIDFLSTHIPGTADSDEECLLLVHVRQVVGQVRYRICSPCAQGVITAVAINEPFDNTGLDTRALSHLRARNPDVAWHSTSDSGVTRDLLLRMRIPATTSLTPCPHAPNTA